MFKNDRYYVLNHLYDTQAERIVERLHQFRFWIGKDVKIIERDGAYAVVYFDHSTHLIPRLIHVFAYGCILGGCFVADLGFDPNDSSEFIERNLETYSSEEELG